MHELGIVQSIVDKTFNEMQKRNLSSVEAIGVKIGSLTDLSRESLEFCFGIIVGGTALANTRLTIQEVPATASCRACGEEFRIDNLEFVCPRCRSGDLELTGGQELEIAYLEINDSSGATHDVENQAQG